MDRIDLDHCILVAFCNEFDQNDKPLVKIGYEKWLGEHVNVKDLIKNKQHTTIFWPDVPITNNSSFKKVLKKANFLKYVVDVLAVGEWEKLAKMKLNYEKFGVLSPKKNERKLRMKKQTMSIKSKCKDKSKQSKVKSVVDEVGSDPLAMDESDQVQPDIDGQEDTEPENVFVNTSNDSLKMNHDDEHNTSDVNQTTPQLSGLSESHQTSLQEENEILHKRLQLASEGFSNIRTICENYSLQLRDDAISLQNVINFPDYVIKSSSGPTKKNKPMNPQSRYKRYRDSEEAPTSYVIKQDDLKGVPTSGTLAAFTNAILDKLFTADELAASSPTGMTSNANLAIGRVARPALDQERFNAARNLCMKYFGKVPKWQSGFMRVAGSKCGACRRP